MYACDGQLTWIIAWDRVSLVQVKKGKKAELAAKAGYINMHV